MPNKKRTPKGECSIVSRSNRLRLRICKAVSPTGKIVEIALNMADSPSGRVVASQILAAVQLDIYQGHFDPTLEKYKRVPVAKQETVYGLWMKFVEYRSANIKASTLDYYQRIIGNKLKQAPQTISSALNIRDWLIKRTTPAFAARILSQFSAAVTWGIKYELIDLIKNPYEGMGRDLKPRGYKPPPADAFNSDEKEAILNAFLTSRYYDSYYPLVYFLFLTGCRPSEAIGLRWMDISPDFAAVNFAGSIVQINSVATRMERSKTGSIRSFPINTELRDLLEACQNQQGDAEPEQLIFTSPKSKSSIDYKNFADRAWHSTVFSVVGRKTTPYSCRDTFITEQIGEGISTQIIAKWVDNSPEMIDKKYFDLKAIKVLPKRGVKRSDR
jgi:integrase